MKAGYSNFEILKWEYQHQDNSKIIGFKVNSKETLEPHLSRITVVDDLFLISIIWTFELNQSFTNLPRLLYKIAVRYFLSIEGNTDLKCFELLLNHSLQTACEEFERKKPSTLFKNYNLKVHLKLEDVSKWLSSYLTNIKIEMKLEQKKLMNEHRSNNQ